MPPRSRAKTVTVQLSAAKSEAEAQATWDKLAKKMPDVLGQRRALFQKASESGPSPWRLRTGGFTDHAQAKAFCDKVKAKGGQCASGRVPDRPINSPVTASRRSVTGHVITNAVRFAGPIGSAKPGAGGGQNFNTEEEAEGHGGPRSKVMVSALRAVFG